MTPARGLALLLALCVPAALAGGCGGDSATDTSGASEEAIAKVRASDYARAVNLHASDLPYFEPIPEEEEEDPEEARRRDRELRRCMGIDEEFEDPVAKVDSVTYGGDSPGGILRVESSVEVTADAEENVRQLKLIRSRRAEICFQHVYVSALEKDESSTAEVSRASVFRVPFPAPDVPDGFGYRFTALVTVHSDTSQLTAYRLSGGGVDSRTVRIYVDILGFVVGPAAVTLTATGAPGPVSKNLERNLLRLLHERATERHP